MQLFIPSGDVLLHAKGALAVMPVMMTFPVADTTLSSKVAEETSIAMSFLQCQGFSLWATTRAVQKIGETILIASVLIAFLQAIIALFQYRTNPAGELIIPPGPTVGIAHPNQNNNNNNTDAVPKHALPDEPVFLEMNVSDASLPSRYARNINRVNRFLFLLLPLAIQQVAFIFSSSMHVLHIGFILTLVKLFDVPASFFAQKEPHPIEPATTNSTTRKEIERILVIGDSLAVGLGTVNVFDANKNQSIDYQLYENLQSSPSLPSPAFPQALAGSLAGLLHHPVRWRSAGVDGGTVVHIRDLCLPVLEEEVKAGRAPDCVIILCGLNDLKKVVSNPLKPLTPKDFRGLLNDLIVEIRRVSPGTKVILPALPTQMIHYNSPLNIFPLLFFIDIVVGFWESQKKVVVDTFPSNDVMYVPLSKDELASWYAPPVGPDMKKAMEESALIAIDGVHPNARCYSRWAQTVGQYLFHVSR